MGGLTTIAEMAKQLSIPESTARYYRDRFKNFIPCVGTGRNRRYQPEALDVLRMIADLSRKGRTAEDIAVRLSETFPSVIDVEQEPQRSHAVTQQTDLDQHLAPILTVMTQTMQQVATAMDRIADQDRELQTLRDDLAELRAAETRRQQELESHDLQLVERMRQLMAEHQQNEGKKSVWQRLFGK